MYGKQLMMITKNGMNPSVSTEILEINRNTKNKNLIYIYTNFIQKAFGLKILILLSNGQNSDFQIPL